MNLFYQPLIPEATFYLDPEESRHCVKVLRHSNGDKITITDGKGIFYEAIVTNADPRKCSFQIQHQQKPLAKDFFVHIAISPTKNADRIEWFVEKAVELGIDEITLLACKNTERTHIKAERLEKMAISAMKQSLKPMVPRINNLTAFTELIATTAAMSRFIAYVDNTNPHHLKDLASKGGRYLVIIGPEGDFTPQELELALQKGFQKVSLGPSRLRTETAGLAACHILNLINS